MRIIRTNHIWRVVESDSGVNYCLERLAMCKSYRVAELCHELGCSQRYLHTMFMRDIGLPPKHWMLLERMVVARRKLEGGLSAEEVALDLGYLSILTFRRQFSKCYQMGPEKFMKARKVFDPHKKPVPEKKSRKGG
ncbi:MAG: AraC family transcriptional regulator [Luteolibacter sp.]